MATFLIRYKYTLAFILSLAIAIVLFTTKTLDHLFIAVSHFALVSAFIAGFLSSITVTTATASLYFVELGEHVNPLPAIIVGGLGAMCADLIMYRVLKEGVLTELKLAFAALLSDHQRERMEELTEHRVFTWIIPFLASVLIASPLPNELGIALFGTINFRPKYLSVITFILNTIGIAILVFIGHALA